MNKIRVCPICLHNKSKLLYNQKFAEHFEHKIVSCIYCGFVYVQNAPSQKYYDEYYKTQSKYEGTRQHEMHDTITYKTIDYILKKYISKNSNILDIGCSTGKLLGFIKKKGYKNLTGVEPAPECKMIAKNNYGVSVVTSTLDNFKTNIKYDLIIFSQVLEHLTDLRNAILKAQFLLKDGGMVFIGVPDAENFYKEFDEPYGEFSTEHINFFSKKSISFLMSKFNIIYETSNNYAQLTLWLKKSQRELELNNYIQISKQKMNNILKIIKLLPKDSIVWGVGALTQRLLKTTNIKHKIFKFVDNNINLIGKKIEDVEIISPKDLKNYSNSILICSFRFKNEIYAEIKKRKLKNKVITFK